MKLAAHSVAVSPIRDPQYSCCPRARRVSWARGLVRVHKPRLRERSRLFLRYGSTRSLRVSERERSIVADLAASIRRRKACLGYGRLGTAVALSPCRGGALEEEGSAGNIEFRPKSELAARVHLF